MKKAVVSLLMLLASVLALADDAHDAVDFGYFNCPQVASGSDPYPVSVRDQVTRFRDIRHRMRSLLLFPESPLHLLSNHHDCGIARNAMYGIWIPERFAFAKVYKALEHVSLEHPVWSLLDDLERRREIINFAIVQWQAVGLEQS